MLRLSVLPSLTLKNLNRSCFRFQIVLSNSFSTNIPDFNIVEMPSLSPTMYEGTIGQWLKQPGEMVSAGSLLCEVETDKATVGFEFQDDAILAKILVPEKGPEIKIGTPIAITVDDEDAFTEFLAADASGLIELPTSDIVDTPSDPSPPPTIEQSNSHHHSEVPKRTVSGEYLLMPATAHLARSKHIDVSSLKGTGKGGRITKGDVLDALSKGVTFPTTTSSPASSHTVSPPPQAIPPPLEVSAAITTDAGYEDTKASSMRKVIAKRLTESKATVPHSYASMKCELDVIMKFRKMLAQEQGIKVSVNDLIIKSAALALRDVPELNASFDPKSQSLTLNNTIDVSVAVATPGGLITPIITGADKRGLGDITDTIKELAGRAREGKLQPHEYQGGTFSLSNLGMFGVSEFSAVINPPQAVIMAVGGGVRTVLPDGEGGVRVASVMTARISCDRRVGDEALSGLFLQSFKNYMTQPHLLLL
jgi:pyruvate dehydrogenase complex dihydrolipoamide acetyltransferase long form